MAHYAGFKRTYDSASVICTCSGQKRQTTLTIWLQCKTFILQTLSATFLGLLVSFFFLLYLIYIYIFLTYPTSFFLFLLLLFFFLMMMIIVFQMQTQCVLSAICFSFFIGLIKENIVVINVGVRTEIRKPEHTYQQIPSSASSAAPLPAFHWADICCCLITASLPSGQRRESSF